MVNIKKAYSQYEAIRVLGQTNMYDQSFVKVIAFHNKYYDLITLMDEKSYSEILKDYDKYIKLIKEGNIIIPIANLY